MICVTRYCVLVDNYSSWWKWKHCWCIPTWHFSRISLHFFGHTLHLPWVADVKKWPLESLKTILRMLLFNLGLFLSAVAYWCTRLLRNWSWLLSLELIFFSGFKWWNNRKAATWSKLIRLISCVQFHFFWS